MNSAAVNIRMHVPFQIVAFSGTASISQCLKSFFASAYLEGFYHCHSPLLFPAPNSLNTHTHTPLPGILLLTASSVTCPSSQWNLPRFPPSTPAGKSLSFWSLTALLLQPLTALSCHPVMYLMIRLRRPRKVGSSRQSRRCTLLSLSAVCGLVCWWSPPLNLEVQWAKNFLCLVWCCSFCIPRAGPSIQKALNKIWLHELIDWMNWIESTQDSAVK